MPVPQHKSKMEMCPVVGSLSRPAIRRSGMENGPVWTSPLAYKTPTPSRSQRGPANWVSEAKSVKVVVDILSSYLRNRRGSRGSIYCLILDLEKGGTCDCNSQERGGGCGIYIAKSQTIK